MLISKLTINNFRGIKSTTLYPTDHVVLIGDNNVGKTSILEAIDLAMGPDRLNHRPVIDEHDFYAGKYLKEEGETNNPHIYIEVVITNLNEEQQRRFNAELEYWDTKTNDIAHSINDVEENGIPCIRISFDGYYDQEEDNFKGETFFTRGEVEGNKKIFTKKDKQMCGFLYLRTTRTGTRALSLEHGSLMDIILRLKEIRPQMWEDVISDLKNTSVATKPELGISDVIQSIVKSMEKYVPRDWGISPSLKVSKLTREDLRKIITAFIPTGTSNNHIAPFYRQGTGTINMLVLAMLSQIAADKQNVIFAMEEPEISVPPYTQKRIVHEIKKLSSQSFFTSHSPYIIEEFPMDDTFVLSRDNDGKLTRYEISLPTNLKPKQYALNFRTKFCEALLAKRVIIAEGNTEFVALPTVARHLSAINPAQYSPLEALGFAVLDAGGETNIEGLAKMFVTLNKDVYAICDNQPAARKTAIETIVKKLFMHNMKGTEKLIIENTPIATVSKYLKNIGNPTNKITKKDLFEYFKDGKGDGRIADFLESCSETEIPQWLKDVCLDLKLQTTNESVETETEMSAE